MRTKRYLLLMLVLVLGLALRLVGLGFGLPDLVYGDEVALVNHALGFGSGDMNPHWFEYPALMMYVLFVLYGLVYAVGRLTGVWDSGWAFAVSYFRDPTLLQTLSRSVSAFAGAASVWLVYCIGSRLFGRRTGLIAALILAVSPMHVEHSHYAVTDVPMTCLALLAIFLALRSWEAGNLRGMLVAAFIGGLAGATKYPGLAAIPAVAAAPLLLWKGRQNRLAVAAGCCVAGLAGFAIGAPYTFLDWGTFTAGMRFQSNLVGQVGHLGFENASSGFINHIRYSLVSATSVPVLAMAAMGLVIAIRKQPLRTLWLLIFPALVYVVIGSQKTQFGRYALPLVPFVALFCGALWGWLWERAEAACRSALQRTLAQAALSILVAAAVYPMLISSVSGSLTFTATDTRTRSRRWIETHIPQGSPIAISRAGPALTPSPEGISMESARVEKRHDEGNASHAAREKTGAKFSLFEEAAEGKKRYKVYSLDRFWREDTYGWLVSNGVRYAAIDDMTEFRFREAGKFHLDEVDFFDQVHRWGTELTSIAPEPLRFKGIFRLLNTLELRQPGPRITIYSIEKAPYDARRLSSKE